MYAQDKDIYVIGRDLEADITINLNSVSKHHLIIQREGNQWYAIDNNSTNGTYLNSYDNRIKKVLLERDNILYLSTYKLSTNRIFDLIEGKEKLQKITVDSDKILLGRNPKADIFIDNPNISLNHAEIRKEQNGDFYIYDLKSTNGTFVNNQPVLTKAKIVDGDKITLGLYSFIFKETDSDEGVSIININQKGFRLDIKNVSFIVKAKDEHKKSIDKVLLDDISFTIYPGEMVGLMGLSGAGKTTLLKIISGYSKPTKGKVLINGEDLYENYNRIKNFIGYVPQDDIVHSELTVYEALFYSSKLRLADDLTKEEIDKRIDKVLKDLGIYETKNTLIGSPDTQKGISGGQRKRVNIAMELLANPEIIFLDEPTSGLSSVDTKILMDKLKQLSDSGKTIILTIHQPSLENYKKMDNIIILTHGKMAYFGSTYPESISFFNNSSSEEILSQPDNALLGLEKGEKNNKNWQEIYKNSSIYKKFVEGRAKNEKFDSLKSYNKKSNNSFFTQFKVLTNRYLNIKLKDKINMFFLLIQAPVIALLLVILFEDIEQYKENPNILLFILIISAIWFGVINAVREIVSEKAIFERERLLGLKLIPYILSKFLILSVLSLIQVLLLVFIVNSFIPLSIDMLNGILIIFLTSLSGLAIGLLISTISKTPALALTIVPIVLLPMIMFAGGMVPIKDMSFTAYSISSLMPTRWSYEELIRSYDNNESDKSLREPIKTTKDKKSLIYEVKSEDLNQSKKYEKDIFYGDSASCEKRRCIEDLYVKLDENDNYILRNNSSRIIYIIMMSYILLLLLLTIMILKIRDKN